jgi:hypothetical protein
MQARIMYIECKAGGLHGPARIGRVTFSRSGQTIYYKGRELQRFKGYKANHFDVETRDEYWISGCKKRGGDRLYPGVIEIDEDVREAYWTEIRGLPECKDHQTVRCNGKH